MPAFQPRFINAASANPASRRLDRIPVSRSIPRTPRLLADRSFEGMSVFTNLSCFIGTVVRMEGNDE